MKLIATLLVSAGLVLSGAAVAQEKKDAAAKPAAMTMQQCKDYMDMAKKDASKKDAAKEKACGDMMKADAAKKDAPKK
jgi:hypothetical protein